MNVEPQKEHQWLHRMIGDWSAEGEALMEPGKPPAKWTATETVRSLGGVWVIAESHGLVPDGGASMSVMSLGYDPAKKRFVGTFIASMMTNLWVYDGALNEAGVAVILDTEGPNMNGAPGALAKYQDIIEFKSDDHRTLTSRTQSSDGTWIEFMTVHYRRRT